MENIFEDKYCSKGLYSQRLYPSEALIRFFWGGKAFFLEETIMALKCWKSVVVVEQIYG